MKARYIISILLLYMLSSCNKEQLLNEKPNSNIVVPKTLNDFTLLLDNYNEISFTSALPMLSADEYFYENESEYQSAQTATERNSYIWAKDVFGGEVNRLDWNKPFEAIFYSNVVLDGFSKLSASDQNSLNGNMVKGWALFLRAFNYNNLAESFTKPYSATAPTDLGLPLKVDANIDEIKQRSSLSDTYNQILTDAKLSASLLPATVPVNNRNRPSKPAAYALLSRIYLNMRDYDNANKYADSALNIYNTIIDYNNLSTTSTRPFPINFGEILFCTRTYTDYGTTNLGPSAIAKIDTNLINSYDNNDLRKALYYSSKSTGGKIRCFLKRGYTASGTPFTGLATDELFLIKAECLVRNNQLNEAEAFLNDLLIKRYITGTYTPFNATTQQSLMDKILSERRKELVFRGARWADLRRLNMEGANITLTRNLDGVVYTLPPNDPRYVMPIPQDEINLSHIAQNQR